MPGSEIREIFDKNGCWIYRGVVGYCLKCKVKRTMKDVIKKTLSNGRPAVKGKCSICTTTMFKIGKA